MRIKCPIKDCDKDAVSRKFGLCKEHAQTGLDPIALASPRQARRKAKANRNAGRTGRHAPRS